MPVLITPHRGRGIPVHVTTTTTEKLGSETIVKLKILEDKFNYQVIRGIRKRWTLTQLKGPEDYREYVAFIIDRQTHGRLQEVSVSLREKPIDIIKRHVVHNKISGPYRAQDFLDIIFKNTGLEYEVPSDLYYADIKDSGEGETVEDLVKKAMDIWDLEFEIKYSHKAKKYTFVFTPYLEKRASYHIDDEINANNMKYEEDSGQLYTYAVGYGDYSDDEGLDGAGLIEYFEHPEMKDIGKFEAPPIKDGTIKDPEIMKAKLQTLIYDSIKISLTLDFITLRKYYKNAIPKVGDVVKVKHSILGINQFMRIVEVTTVRDADNKIVKQDVTLGDFNRHARYLKRLSEAAQVIGGLGGGSFATNYRKTESKANSAVETSRKVTTTDGGKGSSPIEIKGEDGKTYDLSNITVDNNGILKVKEVK
ncbi:phage tail protein [Staphylococcus caprae]|uniref:tail tube TT1 domain-containing protein n=1 Tax=Staphylococcus caprae TaxID=29380 RepID=UPI0030C5D632